MKYLKHLHRDLRSKRTQNSAVIGMAGFYLIQLILMLSFVSTGVQMRCLDLAKKIMPVMVGN